MKESKTGQGRWISYASRPDGKNHLSPADRALAEQTEVRRAESQGHLLCEVHVRVYEHAAEPYVTFDRDASLSVDSAAHSIAAAVLRARESLRDWQ